MWQRIKACCLNSLTIAWGYCLAFAGAAMQAIDPIADALGDPSLRDQISAVVGNAETAGRILLGISIITIIARLRSIRRAA